MLPEHLGEEPVELEFLEEPAPEPGRPELPGPADPEAGEQDFANVLGDGSLAFAIRDESALTRVPAFLDDFDRPPAFLDLRGIEFTQMEDATSDRTGTRNPRAFGERGADVALEEPRFA